MSPTRKRKTTNAQEVAEKVAKFDDGKVLKKKSEIVVIQQKDESSQPIGERRKKRPWRNKVRKLAAKKASAQSRESLQDSITVLPKSVIDETKKKKKRGPKKKKWKPENEEKLEAEEEEDVLDSLGEAKKKLEAGRFRYLNEKLYTMSGSDALEFFKQDPQSFECYHKGFADQVKKWPNHPLKEMIRWVQTLPENSVVLDLGCGEAKIAESLSQKYDIRSFDLVAVNDRVQACDMAHLPLEDSVADGVIFCLSLMGTNLHDFVKEARRVLKTGAILKIAEVASRFVNIKFFCEAITKMGFELISKNQLTDYFVMFEFRKVDTVANKRPFGLKLKPCLYKKR